MMNRGWLQSLMFGVLRYSGLPFLCRELLQRGRVTILCYHDPSRETARRHFALLARCYNIVSLRDYLACRATPGYRLPSKALVLTLDDGHRNNFALLDVLREYRIPATIFVCSAIVGTRRHYWWKEVKDRRMAQALKYLSDEERLAILAELGFRETAEFTERQALAVEEIKEMMAVADFQSHTRFHPVLPQCHFERARDEVAGSKQELERKLKVAVYALAYPNGDYTERDAALARESGYQCALGLDGGYNDATTDPFRLRRITMSDEAGPNEMVVRASGLWGFIERIARGKRRRLDAGSLGAARSRLAFRERT